jgi:hypothetical protein
MKTKKLIEELERARHHATLETASFDNITAIRDKPVTFADGRLVTEDNVTDFIRERVSQHHRSWIIGAIDSALEIARATVAHTYKPRFGQYGNSCSVCGKRRDHTLHRKYR